MKRNILMNSAIRKYAQEKGVRLWEVADTLSISQATMTRKLRRELPSNERKEFLAVIDRIAAGRAGAC